MNYPFFFENFASYVRYTNISKPKTTVPPASAIKYSVNRKGDKIYSVIHNIYFSHLDLSSGPDGNRPLLKDKTLPLDWVR